MMNKEKNFVSSVIYVHNAENRLERFLKTIIDVMENNFLHSEIICVNDASEDGSVDIIRKIGSEARLTSISVINMSYFHGVEHSMNAGIDLSIGDYVFEFDSTCLDFSPSVIMEIYYRSLQGYDIVNASADRKLKFTSGLFYQIFNHYVNGTQKITTERFRILSRRVINRVSSMSKMVPYRKAMYNNCGLKATTIKYKVVNDAVVESDKQLNSMRSSMAIEALMLFTDVGFQFSKSMSLLMIGIAALTLIYTIVAFIISKPVEGWTSTVLFLSVIFMGLFIILTIIIKYLQILVELVFKRQHYSYESIEKVTK